MLEEALRDVKVLAGYVLGSFLLTFPKIPCFERSPSFLPKRGKKEAVYTQLRAPSAGHFKGTSATINYSQALPVGSPEARGPLPASGNCPSFTRAFLRLAKM